MLEFGRRSLKNHPPVGCRATLDFGIFKLDTQNSAAAQAAQNSIKNKPGEPAPEVEWAEWVYRISQHDEAALCALYDAALNRVYGLALRITGIPCIAEEVVEAVFFQVWKTAASYDAKRGCPLTWLLMICRSHAIAWLRTNEGAASKNAIDAMSDDMASEEADPQTILLAMEQNKFLHEALASLASCDRQLLMLAFFRGLSYSEIAMHMAMPLGTVKTRIRTSLHFLRGQITSLNLQARYLS